MIVIVQVILTIVIEVVVAAELLVLEVVLIVVVVMILNVMSDSVTVVVRALVYAGVVADTFDELLAVDMGVKMLIVVSNVAVGLLMDELTDIILDVRTNIGVNVLIVNVNAFVIMTTAFEFEILGLLEVF